MAATSAVSFKVDNGVNVVQTRVMNSFTNQIKSVLNILKPDFTN